MRAARPAIEQFDIIVRARRLVPRNAIADAVGECRALLAQLLARAVAGDASFR